MAEYYFKKELGQRQKFPINCNSANYLAIADSSAMCLGQSGTGLLPGPDGFCLL